MAGYPLSMALRRRSLIVPLLAIVLLATQALLAAHDALSHTHAHAAECQICAHGAGMSHVLPGAVTTFYTPAVDPHPESVRRGTAISASCKTPGARAPPLPLLTHS